MPTTFREFAGGVNYATNDLNMQPKYLSENENMYYNLGGELAIRYGTRLFCDTHALSVFPITETDEFFIKFGDSTATVLHILRGAHGFSTGNSLTISGVAAAFNGIPAASLNTTHTVTVLDANTFTITIAAFVVVSPLDISLIPGSYSVPSSAGTGDILNMTYFNNRLIVATNDGEIISVTGAGQTITLWNATIAAGLGLAAWAVDSVFVSFAEYGGELIVCDGKNKPLLVDKSFGVTYLQDLGTASNANTPKGRYCCTHDRYMCIAGSSTAINTLYISGKNTSGTYQGDPGTDGVNIDLSKYAGANGIRGLSRYRDKLIVAFDDRLVVGVLGVYTSGGAHAPTFSDVIEKNGAISHRSMINLGDELLVCDLAGVPSISQAFVTGTLRPQRSSELIDPVLRAELLILSESAVSDHVWSVYNKNENQYMLFVPNNETPSLITATTCWVYTSSPAVKEKAWHRFTGWNSFRCGCTSKQNRVYFADDRYIYLYGNIETPLNADYINGSGGATGTAITFDSEWPWADFGARAKLKESKYISMETTGTARYTLQMYIDKIRYDSNDADDPELEMEFLGSGAPGYGNSTQPYGGGRRTQDERLWAWTSKFKIAKLRIKGSTKEPLSFVSMTILRLHGSIRR